MIKLWRSSFCGDSSHIYIYPYHVFATRIWIPFLDDQPLASPQKLDHSICMKIGIKIADRLVYGGCK